MDKFKKILGFFLLFVLLSLISFAYFDENQVQVHFNQKLKEYIKSDKYKENDNYNNYLYGPYSKLEWILVKDKLSSSHRLYNRETEQFSSFPECVMNMKFEISLLEDSNIKHSCVSNNTGQVFSFKDEFSKMAGE